MRLVKAGSGCLVVVVVATAVFLAASRSSRPPTALAGHVEIQTRGDRYTQPAKGARVDLYLEPANHGADGRSVFLLGTTQVNSSGDFAVRANPPADLSAYAVGGGVDAMVIYSDTWTATGDELIMWDPVRHTWRRVTHGPDTPTRTLMTLRAPTPRPA